MKKSLLLTAVAAVLVAVPAGAADTPATGAPEAQAAKAEAPKAIEAPTPVEAPKADDQKVELKVKLPKPMFAGTPTNIKGVNLDPVTTGKARQPFMVPKGADVLLSAGAKVTSSDSMPVIGSLDQITDGDKEGMDGCFVELGPGKQWIQIDLGEVCGISAIVVWHYHTMARVYRDVIVQVADDKDFIKNVRTVFNDDGDNTSGMGVGGDYEYIETNEGKLIDAKGVSARYLRLYSNSSTAGEMNHYIEVEVYGKKGK